jgi:hypothetical protein
MRLSLCGYPDEVDKRGPQFGGGPSSVYHLPRRSGRSPALPYPPSRRGNFIKQRVEFVARFHLDFCLMQRYPFRLDFCLMQHVDLAEGGNL